MIPRFGRRHHVPLAILAGALLLIQYTALAHDTVEPASQAGLAVTRGPYLQMGTSSSVVIRWRTNSGTDSEVLYGPDPASLIWRASLAQNTTEHEVTLSTLAPNTRYFYAVGSTGQTLAGGDSGHFFITAPATGTAAPARIWVLGDSGTADASAAPVRDAYYGFAGSTYASLWLMLGDNADNSGTDSEYQAALFDMFPQTLRQSVLWPARGERDVADAAAGTGPYYDMFTLPQHAEAGGLASGTEAYYSFDYGNLHFICLDSLDADVTAGGPMLTWLQGDLATSAPRWTIAFWHHPPYSKGSHDSDADDDLARMRESALPLLEAAGVDLVLSGHSHSYERSFLIDGHYGLSGTFNAAMTKDGGSGREDGTGAYAKPAGAASHAGTVYAVAGSSASAGGGTLDHPAMFISLNVTGSLVLDVDGDRLDARFVDSSGTVRDAFTIVKGAAAPVTIPDVTGLSQPAANTALTAANLVQGAVTSVSSASVPIGLVVSQSPAGGAQASAGTAIDLTLSSGVTVPQVVGLTQTAATALITSTAGLHAGAVTTASNTSVPAGSVIGQTPAGNTNVQGGSGVDLVVSSGPAPAAPPVAVGTRIAGTFADASGHSAQSHLFYAANAGVWWLLTLTSTADSQGGSNHIVKAFRSSGSDLATATWTAAADSPGAAASASSNCSRCFMGGGRALGVAYLNNAPKDVVHAEVAMAIDGQNGLVAHIRATVTATSIAWESWNYHDEPAAKWALPRGVSLGASAGKYIHSSGPILQQEVDANIRKSNNPDTAATWASGFSSVAVVDNSMINQSNALAFAPLAGNAMLAVFDNGGGSSCGYNCVPPGSATEPNITNLGFKKSRTDGSWQGVSVGGQSSGDGQVFPTSAIIDQNDWTLIASSATSIQAFRSNAAGSGIDAAAYNTATNTWSVFPAPPPFGAGQAFKKKAGLFGASSGSAIWLFAINTDAAGSILYTTRSGGSWTAWTTVPGTGTGQHDRKFISGYPVAGAAEVGLIWTEGAAPYDVVTTAIRIGAPDSTPPVVSMTAPAGGSTVSGAVTISAAASDEVGVASVQFRIDGVNQGALLAAPPYAVTWDSTAVPNGAHSIAAVATDAAGNTSTATAAVTVTNVATVPNVVGLTQPAAGAALTAARLTTGTVTTAPSASVPIGSVVSQSVTAGSQVAPGTSVALVVSSGITVPIVVGETEAGARALITGVAGLSVGTVTAAPSSTVPAGRVISQNPAGNTSVSAGTSVALVVSSGPQTVAVPNVVGLTQAAANTAIVNAGLTTGTVTTAPSASRPIGSVISQGLAAGAAVPAGSRVDLVVSSGVTVPSVVGQTEAAARATITGTAGLSMGTVTTASSATIAAGLVISQNPAGSTNVSGGASVALVVSSGAPSGGALAADTTITATGRGTVTTAAFSTAAPAELLLAFVASDGPSSGAQSVTVSGAGLAWTLVKRVNTRRGAAEIWKAMATTQLTGATVRSTQSAASYDQSLTVVAFRNASGAGAAAGAAAASGAPSVSLTTTAPGSLVYAVGNDWDRAVGRTVGTNQTMVQQWIDSGTGDTFWVQKISTAIAAAGTVVQVNDTAPTTDQWNFAAVEVLAK